MSKHRNYRVLQFTTQTQQPRVFGLKKVQLPYYGNYTIPEISLETFTAVVFILLWVKYYF